MDFFDVLFGGFETNLLIFARAIGMIAFNPILSRKNIPLRAKVGVAFFVAIAVVMAMRPAPIDTGEIPGVYLMMVVKEGFVGLTLGFITDMFLYSVQVGGELMDMQSGLGMAKVFDPITNSQSSVMGSLVGIMIYLYFFVINAHLSIIGIFAASYSVVPLGDWVVNLESGIAIASYFSLVLGLVIKLAMPVVVAALIVQFCIGLIMKSVPGIPIMMLNIQIKVIFGFWVLFTIASPMADFIDRYMRIWIETLEEAIHYIAV
ncbi:MAG: flagellar biosynthetic protein FliR [Oscillospiraceae bacterium]|nr:flagellar biosynthetic protein FliR [Oscillospiraceae bacterium]